MNDIILREPIIHTTDMYDLLLLADPSKDQINEYLRKSEVYGAYLNDILIGVYVLCPVDTKIIEIKNIAIKENYQKNGVRTILLKDAINRAKLQGFQKIVISTANSSIHQLYLYQKLGFEIEGVRKNFFVDNYEEPIFENGIQAKDMIMLTKYLG